MLENQNINLNINDKKVMFPLVKSTLGVKAIAISDLHKELNIYTYDPGLMTTASYKSAITYIDGDKGELLYRGYHIKDLAIKSNFLEVAYLLIYGNLPTEIENQNFIKKITDSYAVNQHIKSLFDNFFCPVHPMSMLLSSFSYLASLYNYNSSELFFNQEKQDVIIWKVIGQIIFFAAAAYKHNIDHPIIYPRNDLSLINNFLYMMFHHPSYPDYIVDEVISNALEKIFILHADHEQNASTTALRTAISTGANPFACLSAAIATLWGPAHGGANESVINMLHQIKDKKNINYYIEKAKDKNSGFKLMGFGHRVYKNYDPRASIMKSLCNQVLNRINQDNPLLEIAKTMEELVLRDDYFIERKLYPNVDFYSGIIYEAIGIPTNMFTVLFAVARSVGWLAHWREMCNDTEQQKLSRPRQIYTGETYRNFEI